MEVACVCEKWVQYFALIKWIIIFLYMQCRIFISSNKQIIIYWLKRYTGYLYASCRFYFVTSIVVTTALKCYCYCNLNTALKCYCYCNNWRWYTRHQMVSYIFGLDIKSVLHKQCRIEVVATFLKTFIYNDESQRVEQTLKIMRPLNQHPLTNIVEFDQAQHIRDCYHFDWTVLNAF